MSTTGRYKYCCADCGKEQFFHKIFLIRRNRPRCIACGSYALDPVTDYARDNLVRGADERREQRVRMAVEMDKKEKSSAPAAKGIVDRPFHGAAVRRKCRPLAGAQQPGV